MIVAAGDDHTRVAVLTEQVHTLMAEVRTLAATTVPRELCDEREKVRVAASAGRWQVLAALVTGMCGLVAGLGAALVTLLR